MSTPETKIPFYKNKELVEFIQNILFGLAITIIVLAILSILAAGIKHDHEMEKLCLEKQGLYTKSQCIFNNK